MTKAGGVHGFVIRFWESFRLVPSHFLVICCMILICNDGLEVQLFIWLLGTLVTLFKYIFDELEKVKDFTVII